jgi:hypothetical protein
MTLVRGDGAAGVEAVGGEDAMLHDTATLHWMALRASDGEIGQVHDVYFSDDEWTIRYLVVDTGEWLASRRVLVSPRGVRSIDAGEHAIALDVTREQVRSSPDFDSAKPVSRQYETAHAEHYGYPFYWTGPYVWGTSEYPSVVGAPIVSTLEMSPAERTRVARERAHSDPHLRSAREVSGYALEASDGDIGHVSTLLFDDADWSIRAIVVDTRNWWPGKHVVIPPQWIEAIDWPGARVRVNATRERIRASAKYDPGEGAGRAEKAARIVRALLVE